MSTSNKKLDIIDRILEACYKHNPDALFIMSLMHQYEERGSLSKKQLEGLMLKAVKVPDMPPNWLATLEATINKMHTKEKAPPEKTNTPLFIKDEETGNKMKDILARYPHHKRVVFLYTKYEQHELLSAAEKEEVIKFWKILVK